jgi:3-oxoadipate enol-lactonase
MPTVKLSRVELFYKEYGAGPPLFLIAGFASNHSLWAGIIGQLSQAFRVIVVDNRGCGRSSVPASHYTIDDMATDVFELARHLGIERGFFCGSSMGGFIVQALAYRYPELVEKMVICNSAMNTVTAFACFAQARYELFDLDVAPKVQRAIIKMSCSYAYSYQFLSPPDRLEELVDMALADPYPVTQLGYAGQMHALEHFDSSDFVSRIIVPALVIAGDQDIIFNQAMTTALADALPYAEYHVFEQCGHIPHIEYPDKFIQLLQSFLPT